MSRFINSAVIGLVVFVAALSIFLYWDTASRSDEVTATAVEARWATVGPQLTEISTAVSFENPHRTPIHFARLDFEVLMDGRLLDDGTRFQTLTIGPRSTAAVSFTARMPSTFVATWLREFGQRGEHSQLVVRGDALFTVGPGDQRIPFAHEADSRGSLVEALASGLPNCSAEERGLCLRGAEVAWAQTPEAKNALALSLVFHNPNASTVVVRDLRGGLLFNNVSVASGERAGEVEVPAQGQVRVDLVVSIDETAIPEWWGLHVAACETTEVSTALEFEREERQNSGPDDGGTAAEPTVVMESWALGGGVFQTGFLCRTE